MIDRYAPERRALLAHQHEASERDRKPGSAEAAPAKGDEGPAGSSPRRGPAGGPVEPLEPLFAACGGRRTITLAVSRRDRKRPPKTHVFEQPFVLIGRCPDSDLALSNAEVGFRHLYLQLLGGRWAFVVLANESKVSPNETGSLSGWFEPGDQLQVGPYTIMHVAPTPTRSRTRGGERASRKSQPLPKVELELINARPDSTGARSRTVAESMTLMGADRQCDLWLRDKSVSRIHASLILTPQGLWVVDLLGRDGVLVDGRRVYWRRLDEGSELKIGKLRFRARLGKPSKRSGSSASGRGKSARRDAAHPIAKPDEAMTAETMQTLVRQMADMQNRFFEHSQLQMLVMSEMLSQLKGNQQRQVREDLARIDAISGELKEILAQVSESTGKAGVNEATAAPTDLPPATVATSSERPAGSDSSQAELRIAGKRSGSRDTHDPSDRSATPAQQSTDSQSRLTRRVAKLTQERNTRWRNVLQAFREKADH